MGDQFQELKLRSQLIKKVIKEEERSFLKTLEKGILRFESLIVVEGVISGKDAFELYDTYGFPIDLTALLAQEKQWRVDVEAFNTHLNLQKTDPDKPPK